MKKSTNRYTITLDDDPLISKRIERLTGLPSLPFNDPRKLVDRASGYSPVAAFIDIDLGKDLSGLDVISKLRQIWLCPIFVVTGSADPSHIGKALSLGADDFVKKPLQDEEIKARLLKRLSSQNGLLYFDDLAFDPLARSLEVTGISSVIAEKEAKILELLLAAGGLVVERGTIAQQVWGRTKVSSNNLDRRIYNLRQILKENSSATEIEVVYGKGYRLASRNKATKPKDELKRKSILIVDDNVLNRDVVAALIENQGFIACTAENGKNAVEYCASKNFDIILMDCQMPVMDGFEATKKILESPKKSKPLVFAMTGRIDSKLRSKCLDVGMVDFLMKPVEIKPFQGLIRKWFSSNSTGNEKHDIYSFPLVMPKHHHLKLETFDTMIEVSKKDSGEFILNLFQTFLTYASQVQETLRQERDRDALTRSAHKLRGMAENIGAIELAETLSQIEDHSEAGILDSKSLRRLVAKEDTMYREVERELHEILKLNTKALSA